MLEEIKLQDKILAVIIRANFKKEGIAFFTELCQCHSHSILLLRISHNMTMHP